MATITLDEEDIALLAKVEHGQVHNDPRFVSPDFAADPDRPGRYRRVTHKLAHLIRWKLVDLAGEPDQRGIRRYSLTTRGAALLAEAREQQRATAGDVDPLP